MSQQPEAWFVVCGNRTLGEGMDRTAQGRLGHPEEDSGSFWELGRVVDSVREHDELARFLASYFLSCDLARSRWLLWRSHHARRFTHGDPDPTDRAERVAGGCLWAGATHELVGKWLVDRLLRGFKDAGLGPAGDRPVDGQLIDVEEDAVGMESLVYRLWPHLDGHNQPDTDLDLDDGDDDDLDVGEED